VLSISPKLKVTIADNSNFSRLVLSEMVQAQPDLEVLDTATDGQTLMASLRRQRPDVILAHLDLPEHSRNFIFRRVQETGVPVLMMLENNFLVADTLSEVSQLGVYDYILKPAQRPQPRLREMQGEILDKIRSVRKPHYFSTFSAFNHSISQMRAKEEQKIPKGVVVIGASTGGTQAIEQIVSRLNERIDACILIAVHLPAGFTRSFAQRLQSLTSLKVVEGKAGLNIKRGKIIVAPGGRDMIITGRHENPANWKIAFASESSDQYDSPSVNLLMQSVAEVAREKALGIILTGMGKDGTEGLNAIQKKGGTTVAQDQASSVIFGMAKSAIDNGYVSHVRSLLRIPSFINKFVADLPEAR
jgi:two-component system chemotaxis response regulator CheB